MLGACPQGVAPFPRLGSCYLLTGLSPGPILPSRWDTSLLTKVKYPDDIMKVCGLGGSKWVRNCGCWATSGPGTARFKTGLSENSHIVKGSPQGCC